jgi:hypothetical protein
MWKGVPKGLSIALFFVLLVIAGLLEAIQVAVLATSKMRRENQGTSYFGKKTVQVISKDQNLPAFFVGRQLMVVCCFFLLARVATPNVPVGRGENIFDLRWSSSFPQYWATCCIVNDCDGINYLETSSFCVSGCICQFAFNVRVPPDWARFGKVGYLFLRMVAGMANEAFYKVAAR